MEAPFRFPIKDLIDLERLVDTLATSTQIVPGSLRLAEGQELLVEQLTAEGRLEEISPVLRSLNYKRLMRKLWQRPLQAQHPRFLRFNAQITDAPGLEFSMRINVPTTASLPRWVDLEGSRDKEQLARLRKVYQLIGVEANLSLLEV